MDRRRFLLTLGAAGAVAAIPISTAPKPGYATWQNNYTEVIRFRGKHTCSYSFWARAKDKWHHFCGEIDPENEEAVVYVDGNYSNISDLRVSAKTGETILYMPDNGG